MELVTTSTRNKIAVKYQELYLTQELQSIRHAPETIAIKPQRKSSKCILNINVAAVLSTGPVGLLADSEEL